MNGDSDISFLFGGLIILLNVTYITYCVDFFIKNNFIALIA